MKRPTVSITQGSASDVVEAKLGDIFFINSNIEAHNNGELSGLIPIVSMITSIRQSDKQVWLFAVCADSSLYTISKINNNKISLLGRKEVTFNIDDVKNILLTKKFPTKVLGINMYGAMISTSEKLMSQMDMIKVNTRMPDVSKWPVKSIDTWARRQQGLSNQELQRITRECGATTPDNKFVELIILSGVVKKHYSKRKQESTELMSVKISAIVQNLRNMRVWHAYSTRFIKVHFDELFGDNIKFRKQVIPEDLLYYSVLIINDLPSYILVRADEPSDTGKNFTFADGKELHSRMLTFNIDNFRWAIEQIENQLRSGHGYGSLHIPTVEATYDPSTTTVPYDLGTTQELRQELRIAEDVAENIEPIAENAENIESTDPPDMSFSFPTNNNVGVGDSSNMLIVNTLQNTTFTTNSMQQNATVSMDAQGDLVSIDTTEMGQAPIEAEESEVRPGLGSYLQYNPIDPEVAAEEEEE